MRDVVLFLFASLLFIACNNKNNGSYLGEKEFTQIYKDSLSERYPDVKFTITSPLTITSTQEGESLSHFLDNCYREYRQSPSDLSEIITQYITGIYSLFNLKEINASRIIPIIKPSEYVEELKKTYENKDINDSSSSFGIYRKYNDQLIIMFAEDTDYNLRYVSQKDIDSLGIDNDTLLDFSIKNMQNLLPPVNKMEGDNNIWQVTAGGNIENSLILLNYLWTKENFPVKGQILISIPNRDILLVADSGDKNSINKIKEITSNMYKEGSYPISDYLFKWNGKFFEQYQ